MIQRDNMSLLNQYNRIFYFSCNQGVAPLELFVLHEMDHHMVVGPIRVLRSKWWDPSKLTLFSYIHLFAGMTIHQRHWFMLRYCASWATEGNTDQSIRWSSNSFRNFETNRIPTQTKLMSPIKKITASFIADVNSWRMSIVDETVLKPCLSPLHLIWPNFDDC